MFQVIPCAAGCGKAALNDSTLCAAHSADPFAETRRISEYITKNKIIRELNAQGLLFEDFDFSGRRFYGNNFSNSSFLNCDFTDCIFHVNFLDFTNIDTCDFSRGDMKFLSFAGAKIIKTSFSDSELLHINFSGSKIIDTSFTGSNLYNSRFIFAELKDVDISNCNLKRANFIKSTREEVNFKSSNSGEVIFEMEDMD